jgi:RNA polymerase sigma factor (sigma-70 family)
MLCTRELEETIASGYAEGYMRFGDLGLDINTYESRLKAIAHDNLGESPSPDTMISFIKTLNCTDLYLATACAKESLGFPSAGPLQRKYSSLAWQKLESEYKGFVSDLVRFFFRQTMEAQDFADGLIADLFLPSRSGMSRIMSYDGRSSLCTWLRVVFSHRAINSQRSLSCRQTTEVEADMPDRPALVNFHRIVRARLYGDVVAESISSACGKLLPRERLLLLWRYKDGLRLGEIAELLSIHQSNVSRRLHRLYRKLRNGIVTNLQRHGMNGPAIEECLQDYLENPYHRASLLDYLSASRNGNRPYEKLNGNGPYAARPPARVERTPLMERNRFYVVNGGKQ